MDKSDLVSRLSAVNTGLEEQIQCRNEAKALRLEKQGQLARIKANRQKKVGELLDDSFISGEDKNLLDAILKAKMKEPETAELLSQIDKVEGAILWHGKKISTLQRERHQIRQELEQLKVNELSLSVKSGAAEIVDYFSQAEDSFTGMLNSIASLQELRPSSQAEQALSQNGCEPWIINMIGSHLNKLEQARLLEWLHIMMSVPIPGNPFFMPYLTNRLKKQTIYKPEQ